MVPQKGFVKAREGGWGLKFLGPFFNENVLFLAYIEHCPKFLEYALGADTDEISWQLPLLGTDSGTIAIVSSPLSSMWRGMS